MLPHDIALGPVVFNLYGLMVALGVSLGLLTLKISAPLAGESFTDAFNLGFKLVIAGLVGARLAYVATHFGSFIKRPAEILMYWQGGLMFQGGLLAGVLLALTLAASGRIRLLPMGDALAPALALGQGIGRLGCLMAGCCYGRPAPRFLGLTFPRASQAPWGIPLYPTQAMESLALLLLALFLVLSLKARPARPALIGPGPLTPPAPEPDAPPKKSRTEGLALSYYLVATGVIRLFIEYFRGDDRGPRVFLGLRLTGLCAFLIATAGLGLYLYLRRPPGPRQQSRGRTRRPWLRRFHS
ncbi:MAG: prolipoprotein diacylglyceryl transferase [Deltaproteobacteria bacterium]|jgi:phosphatidylglycerol:prolipoprotein diacylglycerol transferase|nr:prolipoprotein diacylglyceryl transferase [Deltaproteobacteria bacterium]